MTDYVLVPALFFCVIVGFGFQVAAGIGDMTGSITTALAICGVTLVVGVGAAGYAVWKAWS